MDTLRKYIGLWARIAPPPSNTFDARACKAFAKSLEDASAQTDQMTGQKCIDYLLKNLDKASALTLPPLAENQCDNTLLDESKELMLDYIFKCFRTDRGIILLENHMMFFQDAHSEEEREAWFKETMEEWKQNLHSSMVEGFQTALRLWMLSQ
jgi:hypothetical protein